LIAKFVKFYDFLKSKYTQSQILSFFPHLAAIQDEAMAFYVKPRVPEMTYTVSGGTLNPTHSLTMSNHPTSYSTRVRLVFTTSCRSRSTDYVRMRELHKPDKLDNLAICEQQ